MKEKTLLEQLLEAGYPKEDVYHHESDLYVYVTPLTTRIVEAWCKERGYSRTWHCPKFRDQITGRPMYDCAFNYYDIDAAKEHERKQAEFDELVHQQKVYTLLKGGLLNIREADDTYNGLNLKILEAFNNLNNDNVFLGSIVREYEKPGLKKYKLPVYNFSCDFAVPHYDDELDSMLKNYNDYFSDIKSDDIIERVEKLKGFVIVWF